jgi:DNA processing protein
MSDAVLVAETGVKGGSIITAEIASSYNRDVFAVPGSVFASAQEGCNELIRKNIAALVTSGTDIIEMMGWNLPERKYIQPQLFVEFSENEKMILTLFAEKQELSVDEIVAKMSDCCKPSKVSSLLLGLELNGVIECRPGKLYRIIQK